MKTRTFKSDRIPHKSMKFGRQEWVCLKRADFDRIEKWLAKASNSESDHLLNAKRILEDPSTKYVEIGDLSKQIAVEQINIARKKQNMSQMELARKAGLTQPQLSNIEKDPQNCSVATLRKIARVLDIKLTI
jgi:DNA-binding XRE family transcriptional regulator